MTTHDETPRNEFLSQTQVIQILQSLLAQHSSGSLEVERKDICDELNIEHSELDDITTQLVGLGLLDQPLDLLGPISLSGRGMRYARTLFSQQEPSGPVVSKLDGEAQRIVDKLSKALVYLPQSSAELGDGEAQNLLLQSATSFFNHPSALELIKRALIISERNRTERSS